MAIHTEPYSTPVMSTTGTRKRTVSDEIRHLYPGYYVLCLVSSGVLPKGKDVMRKKGLIGKREVENTKYECFVYLPLAVEFTVSAYTDAANFSVSSGDGIRPKYMLVNTNNFSVCEVETNTSGALTVTSIGDTAFSAAVGHKLVVMGPAYEDYSSNPYILMKDPENHYNFTQTFRYPIAMGNMALGDSHYGGNRWSNFNKENLVEGLMKVERSMFFNQRASGTNETTTLSSLNVSVSTFRGLWGWAKTTHDFGGNMNFNSFMQELPQSWHSSVRQDDTKILMTGSEQWGIILEWINAKAEYHISSSQGSNMYKELGIQSYKVLTSRGPVEVMVHDIFTHGDFNNCGLLIQPDKMDYVYKTKRDFKISKNIQNRDVDGRKDELIGECSVNPWDGGYSITKVINMF